MPVLMVSYQVEEDSVPDVEASIDKMMTATEQARPQGVRSALAKRPDGVSFVGLLELDDGAAPLRVVGSSRWFN